MARWKSLNQDDRDRARVLLDQAVLRYSSYQALATRLNVSRAAVSTVHRGCYPGDDANVLAAVLALFDRIDCPHLRRSIDPDECSANQNAPAPIHNPLKMDLWRACRSCQHRNPKGE